MQLALVGCSGQWSCGICTSDLPQVNDSVAMSLGEMKGYAPFSPDENSLVLFEGRTALWQGPWEGAAAPGSG